MLANEIFAVTNVFTASLASSALTKVIRAMRGDPLVMWRTSSSRRAPAAASDSPMSTRSGWLRSRRIVPSATNCGL
jgi:hypothetical protein